MPEAAKHAVAWTKVGFGEVVRQVKDRIDPEESGLERYVAGEHMDTDDLRLRRWGDIGDGYLGPAFHMRFRPGHVLYGSRRTYLRKVAVADFEGITANTTYVLEPKDPNVLLPELLPFIMQTEAFNQHSVRESKGSVNPYVNFSDLAWYEFDLPPIEEQRRMALLLRANRASKEAAHGLLDHIDRVIGRFAADSFAGLARRFPLQTVDAFGDAVMGRQKSPRFRMGVNPRPYVRVANIGVLEVHLDELEEMDFSERELEKFRLIPGDILLTEGDLISHFNVGRPAIYRGGQDACCFQNTLIRFRSHPGMPPSFMLLLFEGARLSGVFARAAKTTTVTHLGLARFKQIALPLPDMSTRQVLGDRLDTLLFARAQIRERVQAATETSSRVFTEVFG